MVVALALAALVLPLAPVSVADLGDAGWWPSQGSWLETGHIAPDDADEPNSVGDPSHDGATFGAAVAIDGDTLVVGTQTGDLADQGGVWEDGGDWAYVFERAADGSWMQTAKLIPDDAHPGDTFAKSVDVDETSGVIVVGNPGPHEGTNKIYIFERQLDGAWEQTKTFHRTNPDTSDGGRFGADVAVSGTTVITGLSRGELGTDPFLYVFDKVGGQWTQTAALTKAAQPLDIAGDRLVGMFGEITSCVDESPCLHSWVQVYDRVNGEWVPTAVLDPTEEHNRSRTLVGRLSMSDDGRSVVIGSPVDCRIYGVHTQNGVAFPTPLGVIDASTQCPGAVGAAWIYEFHGGTWSQTADIPNPDPQPGATEFFGISVDIGEGIAVVGANGDVQNGAPDAGAAYIYEKRGLDWIFTGKLRNHDNGPYAGGDFFGESVAISGPTVVVGAPWDDQRRDGTPAPFDDEADLDPTLCEILGCSGYDDGENAGSVYVFDPVGG